MRHVFGDFLSLSAQADLRLEWHHDFAIIFTPPFQDAAAGAFNLRHRTGYYADSPAKN